MSHTMQYRNENIVAETGNEVGGAVGDVHRPQHPGQQLPFVQRYCLKYR